MEPSIFQYLLGTLTVATALMVVLGKNPVMSAMSLLATLFLTGLLYFTFGAYFVGAVQILIYAGAISVLFIFIVMLLDLKPRNVKIPGRKPVYVLAGIVGVTLFGALLVSVLPALGENGIMDFGLVSTSAMREASQLPESISLRLLSKYMLPFQVTALLLLAAVMGVIVIGRKNRLTGPGSDERGTQS